MDLAPLMRQTSDEGWFARLAPLERDAQPCAAPAASEIERLAREGWLSLSAAGPELVRSLVTGIDRLAASHLHPTFLYAVAAPWTLGARLADAMSAALGARYDLIADAWAFHIRPGPENRGWAPHRGTTTLAPDRARPDTINVWVALTDATIENSCMYVVPLDADPHYPHDLARSDVAAERARALPIPAGTALAWNANVLHWGGPSSERALAPRISITFTLQKRDARGGPIFVPERLDHAARLEVVAEQIEIYGGLDPTVTPELREWARLTLGFRGMHEAFRGRKEG